MKGGARKKTLAFLRAASSAQEIDQRVASGWLRMDQLPVGNTLARVLIREGFFDSVLVASPGSKRGVRLVSRESVERYFRTLLKEQSATSKCNPGKGAKPAPFDTLGIWSVVLPCGTRIVGDGPSYLIVRPTGEVQALIGVERLMRIAEETNP